MFEEPLSAPHLSPRHFLHIDNSNLTTLILDDEFLDAFVTKIIPCKGRKYKWYIIAIIL